MKLKLLLWLLVVLILSSFASAGITDNLLSIWHMEESSMPLIDSKNIVNMTAEYAAPVQTTGFLNNGQDFEDSESDIVWNITNNLNYITTNGTIMFWAKWESVPGGAKVMGVITNRGHPSAANAGWSIQLETVSNKIEISGFTGSAAGDIYESTSAPTVGSWYHVAITWDGDFKMYLNGTLTGAETSEASNIIGYSAGNMRPAFGDRYYSADWLSLQIPGTYLSMDGILDEIVMLNRTMSAAEVNSTFLTYASGADPFNESTPPVSNVTALISFYSQFPADLTSTNIFASVLNLTYNFTNTAGITNAFINYTMNGSGCSISINGTCLKTYGVYSNFLNITKINNASLNSFNMADNSVYPGNYLVDYDTTDDNTHLTFSTNSISSYIRCNFTNISSSIPNSIIEFMANTTINPSGNGYNLNYVNSSGSSSTFYTSGTTNTYNHTHSNNSKHNAVSMPIINGSVGTVRVSSNSFIEIKPRPSTNMNIYYVTNTSYPSQCQETNNGGTSWTNLGGVVDMHIHQVAVNTYFFYSGCQNTSGTINCTAQRSDNIDITTFPSSSPQVTSPVLDQNVTRFLNITWTEAVSGSFNTNISYYNITLFYSNGTFLSTIRTNNSINLSYLWDTYANNNTLGRYIIRIEAKDTGGMSSFGFSDAFNLTTYAEFNISLLDSTNNATINIFNLNITGTRTEIGSTTNGIYSFEGINGTYYFVATAPGYAVMNFSFNISQLRESRNFTLYKSNSVRISIFDEITNIPITSNITIRWTSNFSTWENVTSTSHLFIYNLTVGTYTILFYSSNYSTRTYTITVGNSTTQTLDAFMISSTYSTIFTISDVDTFAILDNTSITMYKQVASSWVTVESKYSDISGKAQFFYDPIGSYKFQLDHDGYNQYVFFLNPILFGTYDVYMTKSSLLNYTVDFDKISIIYAPSSFDNEQNTSFNFLISSPDGLLTIYGIKLTYPGGNCSASGTNAIGSQLSCFVNVTGATSFDSVRLDYNYTTSDSGLRQYTSFLPININTSAGLTWMSNKNNNYGLGLFERLLICTIIVIFTVGIATLVGQAVPGLVLGLFVYGLLYFIGFIPLWAILPSMLIGVFFLVWKSGGN
jgi:hypothetical protein